MIYYFKHESCPKDFIGFKGSLDFYKNIKDCYPKLEKAEKIPKNLNQI